MPIYEYYSHDTHKIYQFFARSISQRDTIPRCPDGEAFNMQKKVSNFAYIKGGGDAEIGDHDADSMGTSDPRIAGAMAEMEKEFSRMDPDNPDPRAMGAMMEKMSSLTDEKLPADMEEMVGRLKAGESLESIEERFGDLMDEDTAPEDAAEQIKKKLLRLRQGRQPIKDPTLYELNDWI